MGYLALACLSILAVLAAFGLAVRMKLQGRAETILAAGVITNFLIGAPIYALGLTHRLRAGALGMAAFAECALVLALTFVRVRPSEHLGQIAKALGSLVQLPAEAIRLCWTRRSVVLLPVVLSLVACFYTALLSWYAPSWRTWDACWYHEPMIGYAIQNGGFAFLPGPYGIQKVNAYPRFCEMTQLWFVVFTDRRLVEVTNSLVAPLMALAMYVIAKRYESDRVVAMGWACALLLMPTAIEQLQSTLIDVHAAALMLAAAHFATRPKLRLRDALLAAACICMAVGGKTFALAGGGVLTIIAIVRVSRWHARSRPCLTLGTLFAGATLILGMMASIYLRNYLTFHNPFWPDLDYANPKLGIRWPGQGEVGGIPGGLPLLTQLEDLVSIPHSWQRGHYQQVFSYGFGVCWVVFPVGLLAALAAGGAMIRHGAGWLAGIDDWKMSKETGNFLLVLLLGLATFYATPAFWAARYSIVTVGVLMIGICWLGSRPGWRALGTGSVAFVSIASIITLVWYPRWLILPGELQKLARIPYPEREFTPTSTFAPRLDFHNGSPVMRETGLAREKELGPGTIIVHDDNYEAYLALFFNNTYSNKVLYVPSGPKFLAEAEALSPTWIFASYHDVAYNDLRKSPNWEEVGPLQAERWGAVFRRRSSTVAAK